MNTALWAGHGLYVWPAYGALLLVLGGMALHAWVAQRRVRRALRRELAAREHA